MSKIHNCSECDFCYSNETMDGLYLCVNGNSEYLGEFIDGIGISGEDKDCVVVDGKTRDELLREDTLFDFED